MTTITVQEIQRDVLGYVRKAQNGETVLIVEADRAVAELKPVTAPVAQLRPFGLCAGKFTVPDDFDVPLPEDVLRAFEGK